MLILCLNFKASQPRYAYKKVYNNEYKFRKAIPTDDR